MQAREMEIIARAKSWLGTPYVENCKILGVGCDCLGLIAAVVGIDENLRDLGFENASAKYLSPCEPAPAAILVFQTQDRMHFGIMIENNRFIHAHWSQGVVENTFGNWFKSRLLGAYQKLEL